ncbi:MAG: winged helix-turn-helix domain-containing protein [Acidobacteria bacterium]|nr:winged helix-turn-helix domain-containing protein [Acidobacteriota bacterium]
MDDNRVRYYDFGEFRLDAKRRILIKEGNRIPLTGKIFDLLFVMIRNRGQVLEHDELLEKVWEGTFVEQANLKKSISNLRQILGESPHECLYIKTIPRRGYSFVADVRPAADDSETAYYRETETEIVVEEIIDDDSPAPLPAAAPRRFDRRFLLLGGFVLLLAALGAAFGMKSYFSKRGLRFSPENTRLVKLTSDGKGFGVEVSADGNYILYPTSDRDNLASLWLQQVASGSTTRLTPPADAAIWSYAFTPDGNYVYYSVYHRTDPSQNGIYRIPFLGGKPQRVLDKGLIRGFSPDGGRMLTTQFDDAGSELVVSKPDGGEPRSLVRLPLEYRFWSANWTPDGAAVLCALRRQYPDRTTYYVSEIPVDGGAEKTIIAEQERKINGAIWLPDRSSLLVVVKEPDAEIRQIWQYFPESGEWRRVTNDNNSYFLLGLPRDGRSIFTTQAGETTAILQKDDGPDGFRQLTGGTGVFDNVWWTPDGRLVYVALENQQAVIYVASPDGSRQKLTSGGDGEWLQPRLSGDGAHVVFVSERSGSPQLWQIDLEGNDLRRLTNSDQPVFNGTVLADSRTLVYMANFGARGWLLVKQSADGRTALLFDRDMSLWDISPDGRAVAIESRDEKAGKEQLVLRPLDGGEPFRVIDLPAKYPVGRHLRWTPDGKSVAYNTVEGESGELVQVPVDGGEPQVLTRLPAEAVKWFDWSPDGARLTIVRSKTLTEVVQIKAE